MKKLHVLLFLIGFCPILLFSQTLYFPPTVGNTWDTIHPNSLNWCQPKIDSLYDFLENNNTKAFILLKDGKIVLEQYFGTFTQSSNWYWASAGKTITSFMTGIAQQEGYLSISDTTSHYLGQGWTDCTPEQEEKITIRNQLTMTSGLDDGVQDHFCTLDTCLIYKADPNMRWAYHNGPYTLMDKVIENATGVTLNNYTTQKLKTPTGMNGMFVPSGYNNVYFSNARSMARFGLLMLNNGNWNGTQIMTDQTYFNQMINTSQSLNQSYGYLWWLNGKPSFMLPGIQIVIPGQMTPTAPTDMYAGLGMNGQFLDVIPSKNMVWIRMGESPSGGEVPYLLHNEIWDYLNDLNCNNVAIKSANKNRISVAPNPATDDLTIQAEQPMLSVAIFDVNGKIVKETRLENTNKIQINTLEKGIYFVDIVFADSSKTRTKFVKN
jgi:CubicO group peptidase (beta-lactamase class C family)